jgi:hypothetical protein
MRLSTQQQEAKQYSLIGLGLMCLSNLTFHAVLLPRDQYPESPQQTRAHDALILGVGIVAGSTWFAGFVAWCICLGRVSVEARNAAVIYGLVATNVSLASLLVLMPSVSQRAYLAVTVWPLCAAMMAGTVGVKRIRG